MSVTIHAEAIAPDMTFERRGWTEFRKSDTGERFRVSHPFGYETYPGANDFNFYRLANGSFIVADISQGIQVTRSEMARRTGQSITQVECSVARRLCSQNIQMAYETRRRTGVFALEEPTSCLPYLRDYNAQYRHANE